LRQALLSGSQTIGRIAKRRHTAIAIIYIDGMSYLEALDDDGYIADIPNLEACSAFGNTPDDALQEVQKAKKLWIETAEAAQAEGKPLPAPKYRPVIYQAVFA
jgi:predicted RNase H-like HicB family nuclease